MSDHLLIVSSDSAWLQALRFLEDPTCYDSSADSEDLPPHVTSCPDSATALAKLDSEASDPIAAAIIFGFHTSPAISREMAMQGYGARELAIDLHAKRRSLPVILATRDRLDVLERFAASTENVEVIRDESIQSIHAAIVRMRKTNSKKQPWAEVDIHIGVESVGLRAVLANGQVLADNMAPSDIYAFLEDEQDEFQPWQLYKYDVPGGRLNDGWPSRLRLVGERLHQYLVRERQVIENCLNRVRKMDDIHFRFVTSHITFPDVPFEAMRDPDRAKYIRDMSPMARRILLSPSELTFGEGTASEFSASTRLTGPLLVIQSNSGLGTLRVGRHTFDGVEARSFTRLPDLARELTLVQAARTQMNLSPPETCLLEIGDDSANKLEAAIGDGPWDIVHFCGHSVRADDKEVFLVLPGRKAGELTSMSMSRFAQILRRGRVRLLVLCSCEGASSQGVFRVAQEGVPAAVGFRWEVKTSEATQFAEQLHQRLAGGAPLGRAYLEAVRKLTADSPAFLSTILAVQQDHWAEPAVSAEDQIDVRMALAEGGRGTSRTGGAQGSRNVAAGEG
ncbi:CHAT domain-containing protein [Bradyrhizobium sp. 197]|uniref:CHAT domain-containing protein n=1 Tax=Bradyrhizobium sp. 197 TaxID=2782663 RepID=UPI001FF91B77|nr:CHAT domain-containing protein [Bradyrhizobium sp. 197]MCK1481026.1 CHAT domain-containing protein [Bradyrhizobium sp. 197]